MNGYRYSVPPRTPGATIEPPAPPAPEDGPAYWAIPDEPYDGTPIVLEEETAAEVEHDYVSPDCWHGHHDQCAPTDDGCAFCTTPCNCTCHQNGATT